MFNNYHKKLCKQHEDAWHRLKITSALLILNAIYLDVEHGEDDSSNEPAFWKLKKFIKEKHDNAEETTPRKIDEIIEQIVEFRNSVGEDEMNRLFPMAELSFRFVALLGADQFQPYSMSSLEHYIDANDEHEFNHAERSIFRFLLAFIRSGANAEEYDSREKLNLRFDVMPERKM